jgi:hypothetical protein
MGAFAGPNLSEEGLVFLYDPANTKSYPGSGTSLTNLCSSSNNGILDDGVGFSTSNLGTLTFDGVDDNIEIPDHTFSSWVYIDDFNVDGTKINKGRVFVRTTTSSGSSLIIFYNGGYGFETLTNSDPFEQANRSSGSISSNKIVPGNWFYFTIVFDSGVYRGYVNGELLDSRAILNGLLFDRIGDGFGFNNAYPSFLKGKISLFSVYDKVLSGPQIIQNFNATRGRFGV